MIAKTLSAAAAFSTLLFVSAAAAETTLCTNIVALPMTISTPGVYCLKQDLATSATSGNAVTINANSVTIDLNGFKLGGLGGGVNTQANGIFASDRQNITLRNGAVRGFRFGVRLEGSSSATTTSGHIVEDLRVENSRYWGIYVMGADAIVRRNLVTDTGGSTSTNASGISVEGPSPTVTHNIVNRVTETGQVNGIGVYSANGAVVERNEVRDVSGGTANYGIRSSGTGVIIKDNLVVNSSTGQTGIFASGSKDICIGNIVSDTYSAPFGGCEDFSGNLPF